MNEPPSIVGRYAVHGALASGGMATVHIGRLRGPEGFARTVAIKRLHPQFARDPEFVAMFLDEARLAARIRHPNVVPTLDVVSEADELFLVMEYVNGESLASAWRTVVARGERIPPRIASAIVVGALHGLHAAHEARDEQGQPLHVVHRDVSPQNVIVGADGVPRVLDFGVAKAAGRSQQTREGQLKGKLAYMAPEQFRREAITRLVDVYAASVVMWEALTGRRLNAGDDEASVVERVLYGEYRPPSAMVPDLPPGIDAVLASGLARSPKDRYETARDLAIAIEACLGAASALEVAAWIGDVAGPALEKRAVLVEAVEAGSRARDAEVPAPKRTADAAPELVDAATMTPTLTAPSRDSAPAAAARGRGRLGWVAGATGAALLTAALATRLTRPEAVPDAPASAATTASVVSTPTPLAPIAEGAVVASSAPPTPASAALDASITPSRAKPSPRPSKSGKGPLPRGLPKDRD